MPFPVFTLPILLLSVEKEKHEPSVGKTGIPFYLPFYSHSCELLRHVKWMDMHFQT